MRANRLPRVYLAGKIGKHDWRHGLFAVHGLELSYDCQSDLVEPREEVERDGFVYAGPYFLSDDHGCFHGPEQHGIINPGYADGPGLRDIHFPHTLERHTVVRSCISWIRDADVVFCWLDSPDAYGTIFELGHAHQFGIPIFLAYAELPSPVWFTEGQEDRFWADTWFIRLAVEHVIRSRSAKEGWEQFTRWWNEWPGRLR